MNGTFEQGPGVGWTVSSNGGNAIITTGQAYQGNYKALFCGRGNCNDQISQTFTVPAGATLYYRMRIQSQESTCGSDVATVQIGTTTIATHDLCRDTATGRNYTQQSVSLSAYARQTVTLRFAATTNGSRHSSFYLDNVGFAP